MQSGPSDIHSSQPAAVSPSHSSTSGAVGRPAHCGCATSSDSMKARGMDRSPLQALVLGFKQPALEQHYLQYNFEHTVFLDAYAAIYHTLMALIHVASYYPVWTWTQPCSQMGMVTYVCGWALMPCLVLRFRSRLGPRGRELGVMAVDLALALQAFGCTMGRLTWPYCGSSSVSELKMMDSMLVLLSIGVMRACMSNTRTKLFVLSFTTYTIAGAALSFVSGTCLWPCVLRYARINAVAVAISAAVEVHSRRAFLQLVALDEAGPSKSRSSSYSSKEQLPRETQQQQQLRQEQQQRLLQEQLQGWQQHQPQEAARGSPEQMLHDLITSAEATAHISPSDDAAEAAAADMAVLLGPEVVHKLSAAHALRQPHVYKKRKQPAPYRGRCTVFTVGIKVRTRKHLEAGTRSFDRIAEAVISAVSEAAGSLADTHTAAEHGPRVHGTCIQGCVQLLAGISVPGETLANRGMTARAVASDLQALLQELVQSQLQALYPGQQLPEFSVTTSLASESSSIGHGSSSDGGRSSSSQEESTSAAAASSSGIEQAPLHVPAADVAPHADANAATGSLLACSPPCLAAGAGSTELRLLVDVQAAAAAAAAVAHDAASTSGEGVATAAGEGSESSIPARLVVWSSNHGVLVDELQMVACGHNLCRLVVPVPEQAGLIHLALLLEEQTLVFVQPLLVLPNSAAEEMGQFWASCVTRAHMANAATQQPAAPSSTSASAAEPASAAAATAAASFAEAWQFVTPLLADIAYVLSSTAPARAATQPPGQLAEHSSSGSDSLATVMELVAAAEDCAKPWLSSAAAAAHQDMMVDLLSYLYDLNMWATVQYVCSTAAAAGRAAGSAGSSSSEQQMQHQGQEQQQGQGQEAQCDEDTVADGDVDPIVAAPVAAALRARRNVRQWASDGTAAALVLTAMGRIVGTLLALLLLPWLLVRQLVVKLRAALALRRWNPAVPGVAAGATGSGSSNDADTAVADVAACARDDPAAPALRRWHALRAVLFGFEQPGLEDEFLQYRYQCTATWDTCAALYRALVTCTSIYSCPPSYWADANHEYHPYVSLVSWVVAWLLPALLMLRFRRRLGARGREVAVLMLDVISGVEALFIAYRCVTLPMMMQGSVLPSSGIKDDIMFIFGLGLTRTLQQQVRTRVFAVSCGFFLWVSAFSSSTFGMPFWRCLLRFTCVWVVAMSVSTILEVRARKGFLALRDGHGKHSKLRSALYQGMAGGSKKLV